LKQQHSQRDASAENTHVEQQLNDCAETHNTCERLLCCACRAVFGKRTHYLKNQQWGKCQQLLCMLWQLCLILTALNASVVIPADSHSFTQLRFRVMVKQCLNCSHSAN